MTYEDYLKTKHWQKFRRKALKWADNHCQLCGGRNYLNVHHNDYTRLGKERRADVVVLCRKCHERHHEIMPQAVGGIPPIGDLANLRKLLAM